MYSLSFVYLCVLCLIAVPLPPGKNPSAVQLNNTSIYLNMEHSVHTMCLKCRIFLECDDHSSWIGAAVAQSIWRLATDWTAEGSEFESQ
jgi:hypothetical protein